MAHMERLRPTFRVFEKGFTQEDIDNIPIPDNIQDGLVGDTESGGWSETAVRRSKIGWINNEHLLMFLYRFVNQANMESFQVDVNMWADMQYTIYDAGDKGHYDWHEDTHFLQSSDLDRKLSVTVQLSDGSEYEGGDFELLGVNLPTAALKTKGTVLVFPSYLKHRVTPVTKGTRKSLVAWFEGPHWR